MTVTTIDHEMTQGDSVALDFAIVDDAGAAVDLTGAAVKWAMSSLSRRVPLLQKSVGAGITITDAAGGRFTVRLDPADTASLAGIFYFEAEVTDGSGNVSTVRRGQIRIQRGLIAN